MLNAVFVGVAIVLGVAAELNGILMLASPTSWYFTVPGVTTTGPFHQHFIRDIGLVFLLLGAFFLAGAAQLQYRIVLWSAATLWLWGHALLHFWEVSVGICSPSALMRDFPAVSLPAILGTVLTCWAISKVPKQSVFALPHGVHSGELG
jgi:hypothetical protein